MFQRALTGLSIVMAGMALPIAAQAQEVFVGGYVHEVNTPFSLDINEGGADVQAGIRFEPTKLDFIGNPEPYFLISVNTAGDTNFIAGGLSWKIEAGDIYVRPGIGLALHTAPEVRFDPVLARRTDLGSRVLFAPEIAVGTALTEKIDIEASWVHISNAQLFDSQQNPGIDMIGARLTFRFD